MSPLERPRSERTVRRAVLELVDARGDVPLDAARQSLDAAPPAFEEAVRELVDEGRLVVTDDGRLTAAGDATPVQRHTADGTTYRIEPVVSSDRAALLAAVRETGGTAPRIGGEALEDVLEGDHRTDEDVATDSPTQAAASAAPAQASFLATAVGPDVPVGWAHVRDRAEAGHCRTAWVAANVHRHHRRRGLGRRLLVRCVGWAAVEGLDRLYTTVDPIDEETVAFLEAHGWEMKTLCVEDSAVVAAKLEVEV